MCSHIIQSMESQQTATMAYYFCNSHTDGKDCCSQILRTITVQLLRANIDLAAHVSENYSSRGCNPSMQQLRKLIPELLGTISLTRIVIDGLDECQERDQKLILQELITLCTPSGGHCKLLFSSREGVLIARSLRDKACISLKEMKSQVDSDIQKYVNRDLLELRRRFDGSIIDKIEQRVVQKASG